MIALLRYTLLQTPQTLTKSKAYKKYTFSDPTKNKSPRSLKKTLQMYNPTDGNELQNRQKMSNVFRLKRKKASAFQLNFANHTLAQQNIR